MTGQAAQAVKRMHRNLAIARQSDRLLPRETFRYAVVAAAHAHHVIERHAHFLVDRWDEGGVFL